MNFRTEITVPESPKKISLTTPVLTVGSCFAEVIGHRLADTKVPTLVNPFGTIFNPLSMAKLLRLALDNQPPDPNLFVAHQGLWFHYDFHSSLWAPTREALAAIIGQKMREVNNWLQKTEVLTLTFGTAYVYRHLTTGQVVANCHKMPGKLFRKELLTIETIVEDFKKLQQQLDNQHPNLDIILTVSPVRHTRDTLPLNAVSKSVLRVACHELEQVHARTCYFPAYELLLDDLRDYRFYKADLIHPNEIAEEYIFAQFSNAYFHPKLAEFAAEWQKIRRALAHKPLQPRSAAHRCFLEELLERLQKMSEIAAMTTEIAWVQAQLTATEPPKTPSAKGT